EPEVDAAPFVTYMLGVIEAALLEYQASVGRNVGINVGISQAVLDLIRRDPKITAARLAQRLEVSSRQVERVIKSWREQGVLAREGSLKAGRWVVDGAPDQGGAR
ncbi:MAG: HTH domain-containing protein, partial [Bifidobacteriaceae bacterium]|nr:HTH domain-containing protein [Bifidobacteriaceae bacterium]